MSVWTLLFLVAFVAMIAMHLKGHAGHGGCGGCGGELGHDHHDGQHDDDHATSAPDARPVEDPGQVGAATPGALRYRPRHTTPAAA